MANAPYVYFKTNTDSKRVLNTLRYIHANPKTAGMQQGFFYDFSNYGIYDRLGDDGITQWHPAFLKLGKTLDECAAKGNIPIWQKARRLEAWGYTDKAYLRRLITLVAYEGRLRLYSRTLPGCRVNIYSKLGCSPAKYRGFCKKYRPKLKPETRNYWGSKLLAGLKAKKKMKKSSPGFRRLPWDEWEATNKEIENVACKLLSANCYNPQVASIVLQKQEDAFYHAQCQVTET